MISIKAAIEQLQKIYGITADDMMGILGDSVYTAVQQEQWNYITLGDLKNLADELGLIFIVGFRSIDQEIEQGAGARIDE